MDRITYLASAAVVGMLAVWNPAAFAQSAGPVKLGLSAALTGPFNEFGEGIKRGAEIAIEEWNAAGGVLGRKVELAEVLDDQLIPDRAVQNMRRILDNQDIVAIVAPGPSGPTLAVVGMVVADGRPFCNSQAQTPTIVHPDGPDKPPHPNVFSVAMSISSEAEKLGTAVSAKYNNIGIISESTSYGKLGAELIRKSVLGIKPNATVTAETYNQRAQDMTAQLVRLQRAGAEVIVFVGLGADATVLRKTMTRLEIALPLYGSSGLVNVAFMEGVGDLAVGVRATNATTFGQKPFPAKTQAFLDRYRAKFGNDRWYGADTENPLISMAPLVTGAYDCVNVLLSGIKRAGSTEPKAVVRAIEDTKDMPGLLVPSIAFSPKNHSAFSPSDLAIYEVKKRGDKLALDVIEK